MILTKGQKIVVITKILYYNSYKADDAFREKTGRGGITPLL